MSGPRFCIVYVGTPIEPHSLSWHFVQIRTHESYSHAQLHDFRHTVDSTYVSSRNLRTSSNGSPTKPAVALISPNGPTWSVNLAMK